ncbi:retrograde regulation protein 2 [Meredithblackwellia eburnea MCA 4105]
MEVTTEKQTPTQFSENASPTGLDLSPEEEKALRRSLLWKLDTRNLPVLALLFLFSFLDRTNIGNARILGLQTDLKLTTLQYEICLAVYYLWYIISEVPSNLVLKKFTPKVWLPFLTLTWGIAAAMLGVVKNYHGLLAVRSILGVLEGGLLPGMVLYLSMLYKRDEMALRMGLIYSSASLSGAFGGLLARGLYRMKGVGGYAGWRWIFIMEGLMTVVVAIGSYFFLCASVDTASYLTPAERIYARARLISDGPQASDDSASGPSEHERFSWYQVRRAVFSLQTWLSASAYFSILSALYSYGLFVPTIITGLGYGPVSAQLMSVPMYAVAAVLTVIVAFASDRIKSRGPFMLVTLPVAIAGYALIRTAKSNHTKYGALFLMAAGLYPSVPPVLVWLSNNSAPHFKRATAAALQLSIANCGGFVATFIYPSSQGPAYIEGHTIILGLLCGAWVLVALNVAYCAYQNKRKEEGKMEQYRGDGSDRDPSFKYVL